MCREQQATANARRRRTGPVCVCDGFETRFDGLSDSLVSLRASLRSPFSRSVTPSLCAWRALAPQCCGIHLGMRPVMKGGVSLRRIYSQYLQRKYTFMIAYHGHSHAIHVASHTHACTVYMKYISIYFCFCCHCAQLFCRILDLLYSLRMVAK